MNTEKDIQKRKNNKKKQDTGMWIVYGFGIGVIVGLIFGDLVTGMLLGMSLGVLIGAIANMQS